MSKLVIRTKTGFKEAEFKMFEFKEKDGAKIIPFKAVRLVDVTRFQHSLHSSLIGFEVHEALNFADEHGYDFTFIEATETIIRRSDSEDCRVYLAKHYLKA